MEMDPLLVVALKVSCAMHSVCDPRSLTTDFDSLTIIDLRSALPFPGGVAWEVKGVSSVTLFLLLLIVPTSTQPSIVLTPSSSTSSSESLLTSAWATAWLLLGAESLKMAIT
jgi:hypothetical protein